MHISSKTYVEVFEVIKINKEFRENIPSDIIEHFQKNVLRYRI